MAEVDDLIAELDGVLTTEKGGLPARRGGPGPAGPKAQSNPPSKYIKDEDLVSTDDLDALLDSLGDEAGTMDASGDGNVRRAPAPRQAYNSAPAKPTSFDRKMQSYQPAQEVAKPVAKSISDRQPVAVAHHDRAGMNSFERRMQMQKDLACATSGAPIERAPLQTNVRPTVSSRGNSIPVPKRSGGTSKCNPANFGGASIPIGHNSGFGDPMSCDNLRCTACDFRVVHIDHGCWSEKVDYLYFRNNSPDVDKLSKLIIRKQGYRAFCCQCSWKSVAAKEVVDIAKEGNISGKGKWFCAGH